jgi:hypothetical protein
MTPKLPEVKFNKSGYEIRTDILDMAKNFVTDDFHARFQGWEISSVRDTNSGHILTSVGMPQFPGLEQVLSTAEKMYEFVNFGPKVEKSTAKK